MLQKLFKPFRKKQTVSEELKRSEETLQEVQALKRLLRKQWIFLEKLREELLEMQLDKVRQELEPVLTLSEAFFHLDQSLRGSLGLADQRRQALDMVWHRLDELLAAAGVEMIRQAHVSFDARLPEAIDNICAEADELAVLRVIQPGYLFSGRVIKAARVILGAINGGHQFAQGVNI